MRRARESLNLISNAQTVYQIGAWLLAAGAAVVTAFQAHAAGLPSYLWLPLALATLVVALLAIKLSLGVVAIAAKALRARKASPIGLQEQLFYKSGHLIDPSGNRSEIMRAAFFLVAHNDRTDGATIRNVQALFHMTGTQLVLPAVATDGTRHSRTDIRHGEYVLFEVGRTLTSKFIGDILRPDEVISDPEDWKYYQHCWDHDQRGFHISTVNPDSKFVLGQMRPQVHADYDGMRFAIVVTADDVRAATVECRMNLFYIPDEPALAFQLVKPEKSK